MTTLVNNRFYAHLSRTLGLDKRLIIAESTCRAPLDSERVLGGLFEAYVGGMHKEMGMERHMELYSWFRQLMEPYVLGFFKQMQGAHSHLSSRAVLDSLTGYRVIAAAATGAGEYAAANGSGGRGHIYRGCTYVHNSAE